MAINYISKFDENGVYVSQSLISEGSFGIVKDALKNPLTCYYIRGKSLIKLVDGNSELEYDATSLIGYGDEILSVCLNRDGSKLYFIYAKAINTFAISSIDTDTFTIVEEVFVGPSTTSTSGNLIIDKNDWVWIQIRNGSGYTIFCYDLVDNISISNYGFGYEYMSIAINKDSTCVSVSHNGSTLYTKIFKRNFDDTSIEETIINLTPYTKDIKFMTDGKLVCLINDETNSKIEVRSGTNYETIDYSLNKPNELLYHLLLDSDNKIYFDRFDGIKKRYRYDSDLTNEVIISDRLANNHFNEDDIGFIHSEITGAEISF